MNTKSSAFWISWWRSPRRRWITIVAAAVLASFGGFGAYWNAHLRYFESTDDAYVDGHVVEITPQIAGTVVAIGADNTQYVEAGQPLVRFDSADATIALKHSEAELAETVRRVRNVVATSRQLAADVALRRAELARARHDYDRRAKLGRSGAISEENLQHASDALSAARAALAAAEERLAANRVWVDGTTIETNPDVRISAAMVQAAYLNVERTVLPAPVSGFVAKRDVQLGERVSPGTPLLSVVPLREVWVDANFKESQLARVRVGQPVALSSDIYGRKVRFHGRVIGFGPGTGAAFALLPAQNATGNWIKIVQRVPVRIALDPHELAAHPLQIGLSMTASIDVRNDRGPRLSEIATRAADATTGVFGSADRQAAVLVRRIIAANEPAVDRLADADAPARTLEVSLPAHPFGSAPEAP
jgi:membrane fusion protein, multidrug efflux system